MGALLAFTTGIGAAQAAPGDTSRATGQFLSGSLFSQPLSNAISLGGASATSNGVPPGVVDRNNIDLSLLNTVGIQLPGGIQIPLDIAQAGAITQYAAANPDASSVGATGAVSNEGLIGIANVPANQVPGNLTFNLDSVVGGAGLASALVNEVAELDLTVGAVSSRASQAAPGAAVGSYEIADLGVNFKSNTVAGLTTTINNTVAALQTVVGSLQVGLQTSLLNIPLLGPLATADVAVSTPNLNAVVAPILSQPLSQGGVSINLATGTITVDIDQITSLNNLPPSTNLLSPAVINAITTNVTALVTSLNTQVATALQTALNGITISASVTIPGLLGGPRVQLIGINSSVGAILSDSTTGIVVAGLSLPLGGILGILKPVLAPLGNVLGTLTPLVLTPVVNLVVPAISPVLNAVLRLTANVQSNVGGVFSETALQVTVLPLAGALVGNLATSTVGPNNAIPSPAITAISPPNGPDIGGNTITLTGTSFSAATSVTIGGNVVTNITKTPTSITFPAPAHAPGVVGVVVNAPQGNSNSVNYEYLAVASTTTALTPTSGTEAGGTAVTISGSGFTGATGVTFGGTAGTGFTVVNDTTITVTTPAHAPGVVGTVVLDPAGNSAPRNFEFLAIPSSITSLVPNTGPVVGGTGVTVTGSGFLGATGVNFDGIPGTAFTVVNDTTITVSTPPHALGTVNAVVLDPAGNSGPSPFTYVGQAATAASLTPGVGPELGGTQVTITGSGFLGATGVTFDGTPGTAFSVVNDTTITVTTPAHAPGAVPVIVIDPVGNSGPLSFEYQAEPSVAASLTPGAGPETGGTSVTILGTGFTGATGVDFGGTPAASFTVNSDTSITAIAPPHAPGSVNVVVADPAGNSAPLAFVFQSEASAADALVPVEGSEIGGTLVTITGNGFTGATAVQFDGTPGTDFTIVNDETITVVSPAHAPGGVLVVVVDALGGNSGPLDYEYLSDPSVAVSLDPTSGPETGGTPVTITGSGFTGATGVEFDGIAGIDFSVVNDTTITVLSPLHAPGVVDVVVLDALGGDSDPLDFEYGAVASAIADLNPTEGTEAGGTEVIITGTGFTGALGVTFDGLPGTAFSVDSDTQITVTTPEHAAGPVAVIVDDPAGDSAPATYTYLAIAADAASIDPDNGNEAGGTPVTITGTGFLGATGVTFGGDAGTDFEVISDTEITVVTPPHAPGLVAVIVTDAAGDSLALPFTYNELAPIVTTLVPDEGSESGGTLVTITGTGFTGATGVTFDGVPSPTVVVISDTTITAIAPAHPAGVVDVVIEDPAGNSAPEDFEYLPAASDIDTLNPTSGPDIGGTPVTITGSGFYGATGVTFGGEPGTNFVVVSDTQITVTSPANDPGTVDVQVLDADGGDSGLLPFTYNNIAAVADSLDPTIGGVAGGTNVTILGSGFTGATSVTFDGTPGAAFVVVDDNTITVNSPPHAAAIVNVVVVDAAGNSAPLPFEYVDIASDLVSIDPASGSQAGGTAVTITGSGFLGATGVTFDGIAGTAFVVVSDTSITVTTPGPNLGLVDVVVQDAAGSDTLVDGYEYLSEPSVAVSLNPAAGPETGGTFVFITGSGFLGANDVTIDGVSVGFAILSDTSIFLVTPPHAAGVVPVVVVDLAGNSAPLPFEYGAEASDLDAIVPDEGDEAGGEFITLTGSGFTGATGVLFDVGGDEVLGTGFVVVSDTEITVTTPRHVPGIVPVAVVDPAGDSDAVDFEFLNIFSQMTDIDPASGTELGGTVVTFTGTGFLSATAVTFADVAGIEPDINGVDFEVISDTEIRVTTPPHAPGITEPIVIDAAGSNTPFTYTFLADASVLDSLDPTSGSVLGGNTVTLTGSGFTGATSVTFDGETADDFVIVSDTEITVTAPSHDPGDVLVQVIDAAGGNSGTLTYSYIAAASAITELDPNEGPEIGGNTVTIIGTGFTGATGVNFGAVAVPPADFEVISDTEIEVVVPAQAPGIVGVVVLDPAGNSTAVDYTYLAVASAITALSPDEGDEIGGTPVSITGTGFTGATGVTFGGVDVPFTVVSDTTITVVSPGGAPGPVDVIVIDAAGDSAAAEFDYLAVAADVASIDPTSAPEIGGITVTILGSGFTGATGVDFGGTLGTDFVVVDDGTITVTAPAHAPGIVDLVVLDLAGDSDPVDFEFESEPSVVNVIDPASGSEAGGTTVTIIGSGFTGATGVDFGGTLVTDFDLVNDGTIVVVTPPHAAGVVDVVVVDAAGGSSPPVDFEFVEVGSAVSSLAPATGAETGGTLVSITGAGFLGATGVTFDGLPGTSFVVLSDTQITVITPQHAPGIVPAVVQDPAGNSLAVNFEYLAQSSVLTSLDPTEGSESGGTEVTLTGTGFLGATGVTFDGPGMDPILGTGFSVVNNTTILVTTPAHTAGIAQVVVVDAAGNSDPLPFEFTDAPSVAGELTPTSGSEAGGTVVTITGTGFFGATGVTFDGEAGTDFEVISDTEIVVTTPAHAPGLVDVVVLDADGGDSGPLDYEYIPVGSVADSLDPASGPEAGGTVVTITGSGFLGATSVEFDGTPGTDFDVISDTEIVVTTPEHAPGIATVIVIDGSGNSAALSFEFGAENSIATALDPTTGTEAGGTVVTITGSGFLGATGVTFDGTLGTAFDVVSDTEIVVTTPAHAPVTVPVIVVDPEGNSSPLDFTYVEVGALAASINPISGSEAGGTAATITGSGFIGATGVTFNGAPATDFVVVNDTTITVTTPAGTLGDADVVVTDDSGDSAPIDFEYTADAAVTAAINPTSGSVAGGTETTITGSGFLGATGVTFDGTLGTSFVVVSDTEITVTTPVGDLGLAAVVVVDPEGSSSGLDFEYTADAAVVDALDPTSGSVAGGTEVTLTGSGFLGATGVTFAGALGTDFVVVNDTTITVTTPPGVLGVAAVIVLDPAGDATAPSFEYTADAAVADEVDPDSGSEAGGTAVTITGSGFLGATGVTFGGELGTGFTVVSDTTITVTTPPGVLGDAPVIVLDPAGDGAGLTFEYTADGSVADSIDPAEGSEAGGTNVTIIGTGFTGATGVTFGGEPGTGFTVVNDTTITVTTPAGDLGDAPVVVIDPAGNGTGLDFEYVSVGAVADEIDPTSGSEAGGTAVTITGSGFTGATGVTFGGEPGTGFSVVNDTTITVTTPAGELGEVDVIVIDDLGGNSAPITYEYIAVGAIAASLNPTSGPETGGTLLTITGTGFLGATGVTFDGIPGTPFTVLSDTTILVLTPAHDPGTAQVVVVDAAGNSPALEFDYESQNSAADSLTPVTGSEAGGTVVVITGSGFLGANGVTFDGTLGTNFTVDSDTQITVTSPAHPVGEVDVVVVDDLGGDSAPLDFEYVAVGSVLDLLDPTSGPQGGGTVVTLTGSGFLGATGVTFEGILGTAFTVVNDTTITVTSPAGATGVADVIVLDPVNNSNALPFEYGPVASAITSIDPEFGPEVGGTEVTITGTGFLGATGVTFGAAGADPVAGTNFTVDSDTQITVTSPGGAPGIVQVVVVDANGGDSGPVDFEYVSVEATITTIDPTEGSEAGGTAVTIIGTGFLGATGVTFGGNAGTGFTVVNDTTITVTTPPGGLGTVDVIVIDDLGGDSAPIDFEYISVGAVADTIDPTSGSEAGGTAVTITGTGFLGATGVTFGGEPGTGFTVVNDTTITVTTPPGGVGTVDVVIDGLGGNSAPIDFDYVEVGADAASIDPPTGSEAGGTPVTITGTGFLGANGVTFDGELGTDFEVLSDTTITVVTPAHAAEIVDVIVLDDAGNSLALDFEYLAAASVADSLAPPSGSEAGGTLVTITGSGFLGATDVTIDDVSTPFTIVSDTTITVIAPAHGPGVVPIVVVDAAGNSDPLDFEYLSIEADIDSIAPDSGSQAGGTDVTLTGTGFLGATGVTFGGEAGTNFVVVNDTTITVTTPAGAVGTVDVIVLDELGGDSAPIDFEYVAVGAVITTLDPTSGSPAGGTVVTITGTGFLGATAVTFGGEPGTAFTVDSDTQITVTTPAGELGTVDVIVVDEVGGDSAPIDFEYVAVGAVADSVDPASGSEAGGTVVTISGTGFLGATGVTFGAPGADPVPGTAFTVVNDTTITVTTPAGTLGTADVIVLDPEGNGLGLEFEYTSAPATATSLTPESGSPAGGTVVTIIGSGFTGATGVTFGAPGADPVPGTGFTVVSDTQITVTTPPGDLGTVDVIVVDPLGGNSAPIDFEYVAVGATIISLAPTTGPEAGGTVVTITGSGFLGATGVTFGGNLGTGFTVVNDTTITVTTPAGDLGAADVIVLDPTDNSDPATFEYGSVGSIADEIDPASGSEAGNTLITITGSGFTGATGVTFGGQPGTGFTVVSDTQISVLSPAGAPGDVDVVVVDAAGNSAPLDYEYLSVGAAADTVAPASGSEAGGTAATISGTGFLGATGVTFGGTPGTNFTVVNDTTITVTTPAGTAGTVDVVVIDDLGGNSAPIDFEYTADAAAAASIDPTSGSEAGGTVVTITGTGFLGATGVTFGGQPGTAFTVVNDTTITVTTPAGELGVVDVIVLDPTGNAPAIEYEYFEVGATIISLDPTFGPEAGGTVVTIIGSGFTGSTGVTFGGAPGTDFEVVSDTQIIVTTPAGTIGLADVIVLDGAGNSPAAQFEYGAVASEAASLTPPSGSEAGGTVVTITGTGFTGATGVTFGGELGTAFSVVNDTTITVTTPAGDLGDVDVVVLDDAGDSDPLDFEYISVGALVESIDPTSGSEAGGTVVTIIGSGFTGSTGVTFGGTPGTGFTVVNDTTITVTTPPGGLGTVDVVVIDELGGDSDPIDFEFVAVAAAAASLAPSSGSEAGGTLVTITGTGFLGATGVTFDGDTVPFTVVSDTTITAIAPAHVAGAVPVVVQDGAGDSDPLDFLYVADAAVVTSLNPTSASQAGGTVVTIIGTGFLGATDVTFGGVSGTDVTVVSDTEIRVTTPAGAVGSAPVVVIDGGGNSAPTPFEFTADGATVDALDPTFGPVTGGTDVTITGSGFLGATGVTFGGTPGTAFTVVNDTTITVTTPAGDEGIANVIVLDPAGNSAPVPFEYGAVGSVATGLTPVSGSEAGGTEVTITGTGFTGATGVTFDGNPGTAFEVVSDTSITVISPAGTPGVRGVVVQDAAGDSDPLDFEYLSVASAAASLDPESGTEAGGTLVTITGSGFLGATGVTFDTTLGTEFTIVSDTEITVVTPAHAVGDVDVVVLDELGGDSDALSYEYLAVGATLVSINPTTGPEIGGTVVTLTGSGFTGATSVTFGGTPGTAFTVVNDTTITVTSPAGAPGEVDVVVVDAAGNSDPVPFEYGAVASDATSLDPISGTEAGGTVVTITGTGFTGATGVTFGGIAGTGFTVDSDTQITVTTPARAAGTVDVVVVDGNGGNSDPLDFEFVALASSATSLAPESGSENGGTLVTITGTGFLGATAVTIDDVSTPFTVVSDTTITVVTPAHPAGVVDVVVVDAAGNSDPLEFEYTADESVATSLTPTSGSEIGGTAVTITGTGFLGASGVNFGTTPGTGFTVVNNTTITVTSPAGTPGVVDVVVVDAAGNSAPLPFEYLSDESVAASLDPTTGSEAGGTVVTITGSGFTGATGVTFGGTAGTGFTVDSDTQITVTTPAGAIGTVDVIVLDALGGDSEPLDFEYVAAGASVISIDPTFGPEVGGTVVTITGTGFLGATGVTFGGTPGTAFTVVNDTTITVTSPAGDLGLADVIVLDDAGDSDAVPFEYGAVASDATSLTPVSGSEAGGTVVTITGTGFTGATGVTFDGVAGTSFTVDSDTSITVTSPAGDPGDVDVVVVDAAGNSDPLDFEYLSVESAAATLDPTSGTEAGGTVVTITGTGFLGATGVTFDANGADPTPGTGFTVDSDTQITVTSPAHAVGPVDVVVVDAAGGNSDALTYEYLAAGASVISIDPTFGPEVGGTVVTITGSGFLGATGVTFGGTAGTAFTVVSDTSITVTSPAGELGLADVIVLDDAGDSDAVPFEYGAVASVATSLDPTSGDQVGGTVVTITGSGFTGATGVTFGGTAGTGFVVDSDTQITVTSPAGAVGTVDVVVVDAAGDSTPLDFEYLAVASVATSLDPTSGSELGGTVVTITGTGFLGATGVTFDGTLGTAFTVDSDTQITVTTPAHAIATVDVVVVDELGGDSAELSFEYVAVGASITALDPSFGPEAGGTVVTITGSGFLGATGVTFGGTPGTAFTVVNDTTITVTSPAGDTGLVDVVVLDPEGDSAPVPFEYGAVASIATGLDPISGSEAGGTVVTITGTGFTGATGVTFDGTVGTAFTVDSDTQITVTSPAGAVGVVDVVVVDAAGNAAPLDFEYTADGSDVASLDPTSGSEAGGTVVTITGTGFLGSTGVTFDGTLGTAFTVVSDTIITVTSPAHEVGVVDVIVIDEVGGNSDPSDFEYTADAAVAASLDPISGSELGGTVVTITGSGFLGATGVTFDGTLGTTFTVDSDTSITVTSPAGAVGTVDVVVVDAAGNSEPLDFEYLADAAVAASLDPTSGSEAGGTVVTITGTGFTGATGVTFDGGEGTAFSVVSDTTITVTTPAHAVGTVDVIVVDELGGDSDALDFEYIAVGASAASLDPTFGPATGGTVVTITGSGFLGATGVTFGGTPGTAFTVVSDTTITVTSPAGTAGLVDVIVQDAAGNSAALPFEYDAVASDAASLEPTSGSQAGGTVVTITGTGFTGATGVTFDGTLGTDFTVDSDTQITVTSPAGAVGVVDVVVVDAAGDSEPLDFEYLADAAVAASLDPTSGSEAGGTVVTITGSGFLGATGVTFDGNSGTAFTVVNDTTITVATPARAAGVVDVIVEDPTGNSDPLAYEYLAEASVAASLAPPSGSETGGTLVTITGSGFLGATSVTFDGTAGTPFTVVSDTTITVVAPAHAVGIAPVVVTDAAGNSAPLEFEYTADESVATALDPDSGSEAGGTVVTITGTGFLGATGVTFDGTLGTAFTVVSDTEITVTTPAGTAGPVDVVVIDELGGNSAPLEYTYTADASAAASLTPTFGPAAGGTVVTITGSGFLGATGVTFDGTSGTSFTVDSDTQITVTSPAGTAGLVDVIVTDAAGNSAPLAFEYAAVGANVMGIDPPSGSQAGGTVVTIFGMGFTGATGVIFGGTNGEGGSFGTDFTVDSDTQITVTTPPGPVGEVDVWVVDAAGDSEPLPYEYLADPSASVSLSPTFGPATGGTEVTITGSGFLGATGVTFGGTPGTSFTVVSDTQITVTTPGGPAGPVDVIVTDAAGDSTPLDFEYTEVGANVSGLTPPSGSEAGGTVVTIFGSGFTGATGVTFGGTNGVGGTLGTDFTVDSDTQITVTSPPGAVGVVDVWVVDAAGDSEPLDFEYLADASAAASLDPTEGTEIGGTIVTLTGSGFLGATGVTFDGTPGTAFTVVNDTTITVTSPMHAPGPVDVVVVDASGNSAPLDYLYLFDNPTVTELTPDEGTESGGTTVTLTGTGFYGATGVTFDGTEGTEFTVVDGTTITVVTPEHVAGPVDVIVLDALDEVDTITLFADSEPVIYTYLSAPAVAASLNPILGPITGGTPVTIEGTGFLGATGVTFDGLPGVEFEVLSDSMIVVVTPPHTAGLVDVIVIDPAGNSEPLVFEYGPQPSVATSITPATGTELGGTPVTIRGTGFTGAIGVVFDGLAGTDFAVINDTTIIVVTPAHAPGTVEVIVLDAGGDSEPLDFEFQNVASVASSLTPGSGPESGGDLVSITGSGFTSATGVTFDGLPGTEFTVVSDTLITVVSSAHAPGVVEVVVVDAAGNSAPLAYTYFALNAPAVVGSLEPGRAPVSGGTLVTITGSGFTGSTGVTFGGVAGSSFTVVNDSTITVLAPAHAVGVVDLVVLDPSGNSAPRAFEYYVLGTIDEVSPSTGPSTGGTTVTISGQCFAGATQVLFGNAPALSFTVNADGTVIRAVSPAGSGTVDVTVFGAEGCGNAVLEDGYRYSAVPVFPGIPGMPTTGVEIGGALTFAALLVLAGGLLLLGRRRSNAEKQSERSATGTEIGTREGGPE